MRAGHDDMKSGFSRTVKNDPLDAALDQELRAAINVQPSPALAARVRTRIANEPAPVPWSFSWVYGAAGLTAVAVLVVAVLTMERSSTAPEAPAPGAAGPTPMATKPAAAQSVGTNPARSPAISSGDISAPGAAIAMRSATPPLLERAMPLETTTQFSEAEMRGLRRLVRLATQQNTDLAQLLAEPAWKSESSILITELQIAPVVIERLEPDTTAEPRTY